MVLEAINLNIRTFVALAYNVLHLYAVVCRLCAVGKIAYRCCYKLAAVN